MHPVAILSVTTSDDPTPSTTFHNLFESFRQQCPNFIDLNVLRVYVVVHDESKILLQGGSESEAEAVRKKYANTELVINSLRALQNFHDLRKAMAPARCHFISLNSLASAQSVTVPLSISNSFPFVDKYLNNSLLSESDMESISKMVSLTV